jgi:KaiC/GvpD/RAD55 family RecA-like ATPase
MRFFPTQDKKPLINNWPAAASEAYPSDPSVANHDEWGVVTGEEFFVLDVDRKHPEAFDWLAKQSLPNTYTVSTRNGGRHIYFKMPPGRPVRNTQALGKVPGVDIRGTGGYVIAPGSPGYDVVEDKPIADAPEWLIDAVSKPVATPLPEITPLSPGVKGELNKRTLRFIAEGAVAGAWHQELYQAAMNCLQNGYDYEAAIALLSKATGVLDETHDIPTVLDVYTNRAPIYPPDLPTVVEAPEQVLIPASSLFKEMKAYMVDPAQVSGLPTGIPGLDELLGGGVRPGEVIGVLAPAKTGKSSLTHKLIHSWIASGSKVCYASREMRPAEEVMPSLLSIELRANLYKEQARIDEACTRAQGWGLFFSSGYGYFSLEDLERFYEEGVAAGVTVFVLDHFHHFLPGEEYQEVQRFAKKIKTLTIQAGVTTILCIQPKTLKLDQTRITNADIRGGAVVGQALDAVLVLERTKDENGRVSNITKVTLDIARHKLARLGEIYLQYDRDTMDFAEVVLLQEPGPNEKEIN